MTPTKALCSKVGREFHLEGRGTGDWTSGFWSSKSSSAVVFPLFRSNFWEICMTESLINWLFCFSCPGLEGYFHLLRPAVRGGGDGRCATGRSIRRSKTGDPKSHGQKSPASSTHLFARPKLVKSNPQIVRDARCLCSRNSEEVPWFDRWTNRWELFQSPQYWPTWILAEPVWTETQATKEHFRIKAPWSMSSTDPNHVLTWERLSGEKMVVLLAVKEELAWQQSDTDRQMIPIDLCSKVHSVWVEEDCLNLLSRLLTLQEFWTTILWFHSYAFHDVLSRQIETQDGRVLRYATDLLRDDEVVAYAAVSQRLCCDQRVRFVMLCRHNVFVKLVQ